MLSAFLRSGAQRWRPSFLSAIPTNQDLVARRLQVAREKKETRDRSQQERYAQNLKLKNLLHNENSTYPVPELYAIKVSVCDKLRDELKLSGREKRGRVFVEVDSEGSKTLRGLRFELHSFFRALKKSTFLLQASVPVVGDDGKVESSNQIWQDLSDTWDIRSDEDVVKAFQAADEFFADNDHLLKRPSLLLHVSKDPNAPPPPPPPKYLEQMADPSETDSMTMLSFYAFPPDSLLDPEEFAMQLRRQWKPFHALGRVYVAKEGINAQMSVPTNVLENFMECCKSIPELGEWMENGINVDPIPISIADFPTAGVPLNGNPAPPFRNLHIRVRNQIVADGLDKELDWQSAGYDMPPIEWHEKLVEAQDSKEGTPILLDCRNTYETDIGKFDGAEPLMTENFRDSWSVLKDRLSDTPKDAPIMTYCTGGIRCVKVGAYLTQELGFTNVSRLAGGIIAYDRTIQEQVPDAESLFKGTNFVFDGRLGREITEDEFGTCITCGKETSSVSNCLNDNCHKRMVQCESCRTNYHGTCSDACKQRVLNGGMLARNGLTGSSSAETSALEETEEAEYNSLDDYSLGHSSPIPSVYAEMELNAQAFMPSGAHMVSGSSQGRLLKQLASMTREGRILELGTFTGYATSCFLEGAANVHDLIQCDSTGSRETGPYVMSLERDSRAIDIAAAHLAIVEEHGISEDAAEAACALRGEGKQLSAIEGDTFRATLENKALCEVIRVTDALATVEEMARGEGELRPGPFDLVFVDADKTRLVEYAETLLASDRVLKRGGLIVVDNVLWKGLVLEASSGEFSSMSEDDDHDDGTVKKNRRARKLANKMHKFNSEIVKDDRAEVVMLPMRDGLSIIRKR